MELNHFFRSHKRSLQITKICERFMGTFSNLTPTTEEVDRALEAMELIVPLSENKIIQKSYQLFHVLMQAPGSLATPRRSGMPLVIIYSGPHNAPIYGKVLLCNAETGVLVPPL